MPTKEISKRIEMKKIKIYQINVKIKEFDNKIERLINY